MERYALIFFSENKYKVRKVVWILNAFSNTRKWKKLEGKGPEGTSVRSVKPDRNIYNAVICRSGPSAVKQQPNGVQMSDLQAAPVRSVKPTKKIT